MAARVLKALWVKYRGDPDHDITWVCQLVVHDLLDWQDWILARRVLQPLGQHNKKNSKTTTQKKPGEFLDSDGPRTRTEGPRTVRGGGQMARRIRMSNVFAAHEPGELNRGTGGLAFVVC